MAGANTSPAGSGAKAIGRRRVKVPAILQMEAVECGAASLAMILAYHGRWVPLAEMRHECGVSREGSKASNVVRAARRFGMEAKGLKKELDAVSRLAPPFIVFWHFNHFLVVEGFGTGKVYLKDPAEGARVVSTEEFDEGFSGVVLTFQPGPDFTKGGSRPNPLKGVHRRLRGSEAAVAYCVGAGLLLVLPSLLAPIFTQIFVDYVLVRTMNEWLWPLLIGLGIVAVSQAILRYYQLLFTRRLDTKLSIAMTGRFLWHVLALPMRFFSQRYAGDIAERVGLNNTVADLLARKLVMVFIDSFMALFFLVVLLSYDWVLTLLSLACSAATFGVAALVRPDPSVLTSIQIAQGKAAGVAVAGLQSIETLKASGLETDYFARWAGYYTKALNMKQNLTLRYSVVGLLPPLVNSFGSVVILVGGGLRVLDGHLTIGMLVAFQGLLGSFMGPVGRLFGMLNVVQDVAASLAQLDDVMANPRDQEASREDPGASGTLAGAFRLDGYIDLERLTFGYSPTDPPLIQDLDISLKPGQSVALVGPSGSGKSTVAKLIAGLYQPSGGTIRFDGVPRHEITRDVLANSVAMIEQDLTMFRGTVRENLTLWDRTATDAQLVRACQDANIHDVVMALPGGYDSLLVEGAANLSGGQRQRLEIARCLVNDPSILLLDEATSALDTDSERIVMANLRRRGCTCLIVAHRLATIRHCDEIVVLERGRAVQRGSHAGLAAVPGPYQELLKHESAGQRQGAAGSLDETLAQMGA